MPIRTWAGGSPLRAESEQVDRERFRHPGAVGPDERSGDDVIMGLVVRDGELTALRRVWTGLCIWKL